MASYTQYTHLNKAEPENLYHVILLTSHIPKDPHSEIEKIRIPGTYHSLPAAKAAAHSCLFDAGYEKQWFSQYEVDPTVLETYSIYQGTRPIVFAVAPDGTTFSVCIDTTPNKDHLTTDNENGRIATNLYYVVQTNVEYVGGDDGQRRYINIQGAFMNYDKAQSYARQVLLSEDDGISKESFATYDEAGDNERDCGFGENVLIHAAGISGENYLVSVIKGEELESVKLAEATVRIS